MQYNREELAWAAGFFDGEGWVGFSGQQARLKVSQAHPVVIARFIEAIGIGTLYKETRLTVAGKTVWSVRFSSFTIVQHIAGLLWTWLSEVKRNQFKQTLLLAREPTKKWQKCMRLGHDVRNEPTYKGDGKMHKDCHTCRLGHWAKYRARRKAAA